MTESEARKEIIESGIKLGAGDYVDIEALEVAAKALEEVEQYRAIGTVEELKSMKENGSFSGVELAQIAVQLNELKEYKKIGTIERFRELTEKAEPKKPRWHGHYFCPSCNSIVYVNCGKDIYCPKCGQHLDWE